MTIKSKIQGIINKSSIEYGENIKNGMDHHNAIMRLYAEVYHCYEEIDSLVTVEVIEAVYKLNPRAKHTRALMDALEMCRLNSAAENAMF